MKNKLDWPEQFKKPEFIAKLVVAVFSPIFVYMGMSFEEFTTWNALLGVLMHAVTNPVVCVAVVVSVYNTVQAYRVDSRPPEVEAEEEV